MAELGAYIRGCSACRSCEGAAYQLPPFLYAGGSSPKVLVVAQNPGEISTEKDSKWRFDLGLLVETASPEALKTLYDVDFITSSGYQQMAKIFGDEWLTNGKFMYTNAVRCRTVGNAPPSEEMEINCAGWTSVLPMPSLVILMGRVAVRQFCTMIEKPELPAWKHAKFTKGKKTTHVLTIPHYAAMRGPADFEKAKKLFEETAEEAEVTL